MVLTEPLELVPEVGERFHDATGIFDLDGVEDEPENREAHRHAVIVVGVDRRRLQRGAWVNDEEVFSLFDGHTQLAEFGRGRMNAIALLDPKVGDVGDPGDPRRHRSLCDLRARPPVGRDGRWTNRASAHEPLAECERRHARRRATLT